MRYQVEPYLFIGGEPSLVVPVLPPLRVGVSPGAILICGETQGRTVREGLWAWMRVWPPPHA